MKLKRPTKIKKIAFFTDIHWGKRNNSRVHNQDCLDFIDWFCALVRADSSITHIGFLGDWFENRSSINIETGEYSYRGLQKLNQLGLPIYFIVGNHDLHRRTTREIHSVNIFNEFDNIQVIDKPTVIDNSLWVPFCFEHEYAELVKHNDLLFWAGHFEFRNFLITGYNTVMERGPDHKQFAGPSHIFSGHFHKRQATDNVLYIGNVFPMDYGDAGDNERGATIYDVEKDDIIIHTWDECPKYYHTKLSDVMADKWSPQAKMHVQCLVDTDIEYTDGQDIKEAMIEAYGLREFELKENKVIKQELLEDGSLVETEDIVDDFSSVDELVIEQLNSIQDGASKIEGAKLVEIYKSLKVIG